MSECLDISESHPLSSEIASLRNAVTRFQDEAYSTSVKLQRHSLQASNAHERLTYLERENDVLRSELSILRAHPHPDALQQAHPAALQVQQLSLSLRRLSDKLSLTEEALLQRTTQLAYATGEASKAKLAAESAYELASRTRGREEAGKVREAELEWKVKAAEEAAKMSDLVVAEYADLVRSLEAKSGTQSRADSSSGPLHPSLNGESLQKGTKLQDGLSEGKLGLQRLLSEFATAAEKSQKEVHEIQGELDELKAKRDAEDKYIELCRAELARSQAELERLKIEDNTAAKMVSRYMKFSQKSTDTLQSALEALKARHTATIDTLSAQVSHLSSQLQLSEEQTDKLRHALDELGSETLKEAYGRRREIALRIRMINREEKLREGFERWLHRVGETMTRESIDSQILREKMDEARTFLSGNFDGLTDSSNGSLARLITAENSVEVLNAELEVETARRLELERVLSRYQSGVSEDREPPLEEPAVNVISIDAQDPVPSVVEDEQPSIAILLSPPAEAPQDQTISSFEQPSLPSQNGRLVDVEDTPSADAIVSQTSSEYPQIKPSVDRPQVQLSTPETRQILEGLSIAGDPATRSPKLPADSSSFSETHVTDKTPDANTGSEEYALEKTELPPTTLVEESTDNDDSKTDMPISVDLTQLPLASTGVPTPTWNQMPSSPPLSPRVDYVPSTSATEPLPPSPPPPTPPPHALLSELHKAKQRYDTMQRSLRDCHLALEGLSSDISLTLESPTIRSVPPDVVRTALQRLTDYTEDARVEVEIRIADEGLIARGFETLLSVPGALAPTVTVGEDHSDAPSKLDVERQVQEFISGKEPTIEKAYQGLSRKLEDIQHDIAALKRAVHEGATSPSPGTVPASSSNAGGGWSSWVLNSPSSPVNSSSGLRSASGPPPTFGSVMTSPRLRHSPSLNLEALPLVRRMPSDMTKDPFARLGLRIPMPSYISRSEGVAQQPQPRSRTLSTVYMLGFGARKLSGALASTSSINSKKNEPPSNIQADSESGDSSDVE